MGLNYSVNITKIYGINHMQQEHNYSVDYLKRAAFVDELNNCLKVLDEDDITPEIRDVMHYLEHRVKEIDKKYKQAA